MNISIHDSGYEKLYFFLNFLGGERGFFSYLKKDKILNKDDIILLLKGGHGFEVIKEVDIIEVKQGPYNILTDKILI